MLRKSTQNLVNSGEEEKVELPRYPVLFAVNNIGMGTGKLSAIAGNE